MITPPQRRGGRGVETARRVGQHERALHEDARQQGRELIGIGAARLPVADRVGERGERREQLAAVARLRGPLLDHGDAALDGVRKAGGERRENEIGERLQLVRLLELEAQAARRRLRDGRAVDEVLDEA